MKHLTQTVLASAANGWAGNCWQTCVAMLLDVDPETLPSQAECDLSETNEDGTRGGLVRDSPVYGTRLGVFLRKHFSLAYHELHMPAEAYSPLRVASGTLHMLTGRTVRSAGMRGMRHVVVARDGEMIWDPHPSRAGLLDEIHWAFLIPFPKSWDQFPSACVCPACVKS